MPAKANRQYRVLTPLMTVRSKDDEDNNYIVKGYATTFEPYEYYEDYQGNMVYEHFTREAFDDADFSDVIMQYDHRGRVFARQSNGTLKLTVDDHGLFIEADLSKTELSRQLYEDIAAGMITKMSWGFLSRKEPDYDKETHTITWGAGTVGKVYDVSAVSIPANDDTEINARSFCDGVIAKTVEEFEKRAKIDNDERTRIRLKLKMEGLFNEQN